MEYKFKGKLCLSDERNVAFKLINGKLLLPQNFNLFFNIDSRNVILVGVTDKDEEIHILVDYFWFCEGGFEVRNNEEVFVARHVEGFVSVCAVVKPGTFNTIDSIGFYSHQIEKITGQRITGYLNDENSSGMNIKKSLAKYVQEGHEYYMSIGFVENYPYYGGQLLELKSDRVFDIGMMKETYRVIKNLLRFMYQKGRPPLNEVFLRVNERNVGHLFVESLEAKNDVLLPVECLTFLGWGKRLDNLLNLIASHKLYLRHLPINEEDETVITYGRFLMAIIGLENCLDCLKWYMKDDKNGENKLSNRIYKAIKDNEKEISNFFNISVLGKDVEIISKDLAKYRNKIAHGDLKYELPNNCGYYLQFVSLVILYLQLLEIEFTPEEAKDIVPQIMFAK